jgi:hypothetical protein
VSDRLHELAKAWGVETGVQLGGWPRGTENYRPRLDIAHDLLAKLPECILGDGWRLSRLDSDRRWAVMTEGETLLNCYQTYPDLESAVIALAERAAKEKERDHG